LDAAVIIELYRESALHLVINPHLDNSWCRRGLIELGNYVLRRFDDRGWFQLFRLLDHDVYWLGLLVLLLVGWDRSLDKALGVVITYKHIASVIGRVPLSLNRQTALDRHGPDFQLHFFIFFSFLVLLKLVEDHLELLVLLLLLTNLSFSCGLEEG